MGNITLSVPVLSESYCEFSFCISTNDLLPDDPEVEMGISVEFTYKMELDNRNNFNSEKIRTADAQMIALIVAAVCFGYMVGGGALASYLLAIGVITAISSDDTDVG